LANAGVCSRRRAECLASCCSWGRTVINRRGVADWEDVQQARRGVPRQSVVEKRMLITWLFRVSRAGVQLLLQWPCCPNRLVVLPSNAKLTYINAVLGVGLPFHIWAPGPNHLNPPLLAADKDGSGNISRIEQVLARGQLGLSPDLAGSGPSLPHQ
jgi:hypothetical protein